MDQRSDGQTGRFQPRCQRGNFGTPGSLLARIGMVATISVAFLRAVCYPDTGCCAIEFWLLLFIAAASKAPSDDCAGVTTATR